MIRHLSGLYSNQSSSSAIDDHDDDQLADLDDDDDDDDIPDPLGADSQFERGWSRSWLVALLRKGEEWVNEVEESNDQERQTRMQVIDEAGGKCAELGELFSQLQLTTRRHSPRCQLDRNQRIRIYPETSAAANLLA